MSYQPFCKSRPIVKVDESTHEVFGCVTDESLDADGEICDYPTARPQFEAWEQAALAATRKAGVAERRGNVRLQHNAHQVAGRVTAIT
jgi:hypothetical protein